VLGQFTHPPLEPVHGGAGPLVRLPSRIPLLARPGSLSTSVVEGTLGRLEAIIGRIERSLSRLHRRQGISERILGRDEPAAQLGQLPDRRAAATCPVHPPMITASSHPLGTLDVVQTSSPRWWQAVPSYAGRGGLRWSGG
jgi:hypothetical protein